MNRLNSLNRSNRSTPYLSSPTGERLAKQVAHQMSCSRAEAEQYIEGAWVKVDGQTVETPQYRVQAHQTITIDPQARLEDLQPISIVLNKPADCDFGEVHRLLTPAHHARDATGIRTLQRHFKQLECHIPLADAASGLLIFTQDWRVIRKLEEDKNTIEHEFMVEVQGNISAQTLENMQRTTKADGAYPLTKISLSSSSPQRSTLRFAVKGWHKGWISFLCQSAQIEITAMRRTRVGRVNLGDLPVGQWRYWVDKV